jgi:hypothetical protein
VGGGGAVGWAAPGPHDQGERLKPKDGA